MKPTELSWIQKFILKLFGINLHKERIIMENNFFIDKEEIRRAAFDEIADQFDKERYEGFGNKVRQMKDGIYIPSKAL